MLQRPFALIAVLLTFLAAETAMAEVFVLTNGERLVGQWLNRDESPRQTYVVETVDGKKVTLDADKVKQVLHTRPDELEYERIRSTYADTAEGQWELAQWCREHRLSKQRDVHLQRVIQLDPNHAEARRALGYSQVEGKWVTQEEIMIKRGYRRYKGQWKLPQEIEIIENKHKQEVARQEWFQKLKRWRGWLDGNRAEQARDNILGIKDPVAVNALAAGLSDDAVPAVRLLYVEVLGKIDTLDASRALADGAISDPVEEVRLSCLDRLQVKKRPEVVAYFVGKLRDKKSDNPTINRAGFALGRMQDPGAVGPLIDALITIHKFKIVKPGGDNSMSGTFGTGAGGSGSPGGSGLSAGGGPTIIRQPFSNQMVLEALITLTGQNFGFDKQAWKSWYSSQKKPTEAIDARRN